MITKVKLKNWRSHLDSEFSFESGTNVLIGEMGSGKSSVMDGICLGLFGTSPILMTKKVKLEDMIMKKPIEKNSAEVEIFLKIGGNDYSIKRIIEKGKGTTYSEIRENGKLLEAPSTSRVTEIVENILKINFDLFAKAIYSEQNSLDYFLTIPKGQRMRRIDELLMIDKFERARAAAVSLVNRFEERRLARQSVVENADAESIRKNIHEINESIQLLEKEIHNLQDNLSKTKSERESAEQTHKRISILMENENEIKLKMQRHSSMSDEIENSLSALKSEIRDSIKEGTEKDIKYLNERIARNSDELKQKKEKYDESSREISDLKSKAAYLKKEIEILEKEFYEKSELKKEFEHLRDTTGEDVEQQIQEAKNNLQKTMESAAKIFAKISDTEEFIAHLSTADNKCPICESLLTAERKKLLIIQKEGDIKKLRDEFSFYEELKRRTDEKIMSLEDAGEKMLMMYEKIKNLDNVKDDLTKAKKSYVEESAKIVYAENALTDLRREVEKMQNENESDRLKNQRLQNLLEKINNFDEKRQRKENLQKEVAELQKKLDEVAKQLEGKDVAKMEIELRELISKEKEIEANVSGVQRVIKEKEFRLNENESKLADIKKFQEEIAKLQKIIKNMKIFEKSLEQTQIELRKEFVEAVNYTMTNLWQTLYPYQDFVGIRLNVEEGDYVLQLLERTGKWVNVEGIVSGGERSIASLALRIAFSLVLAPQLRWLILDEPTANLDTNAIEDLAETLRERIGEFVDQVFLITHDEKLENAVTGSLYRLEREKSKDGVTKVLVI